MSDYDDEEEIEEEAGHNLGVNLTSLIKKRSIKFTYDFNERFCVKF
jgi:hypothetical protein